jgi:hypothetical protein
MTTARGSTKRERQTKRYAEWRALVFRRDGYRCVTCGAKRGIQAHHKKPFALYVSLRYEVSNGQTLCSKCHEIVHKKSAERCFSTPGATRKGKFPCQRSVPDLRRNAKHVRRSYTSSRAKVVGGSVRGNAGSRGIVGKTTDNTQRHLSSVRSVANRSRATHTKSAK